MQADPLFERWLQSLEARHLADLKFAEVARALRALSSTYVERRQRLSQGAALSGAGKRAAFALFYGPLHYLLVRGIVRSLEGAMAPTPTVVDLGCGTGASGAAWAAALSRAPRIIGIDRHPWVLEEAARTYREFGLSARTIQHDIGTVVLPPAKASLIAAFALNEMSDASRDALLQRLVGRASLRDRVLIIEPVAGFVARWWDKWREIFIRAGGEEGLHRIRVNLPPIVAKLDRAAGLDHRELTGRSLWLAPRTST